METPARAFLSFGDAFFLYLEREGTPLNIAAVAVFDGIISVAQFTKFIESKLPQIPRYLQRVEMPPLNIGLPSWNLDPHFDITKHVREVKVTKGTDSEFKAAVSAILSTNLDRSRPLWDFTLVHGLSGRRTGLIVRVHHSMADGLSGVGLLNTLLDSSPRVPRISRKNMTLPKPPERAVGSDVIEAAMQSCFTAVERVLTTGNELLQVAQTLTAARTEKNGHEQPQAANPFSAMPSAQDLGELLPQIGNLPHRLAFNNLCHGPQRFEWTQLSLADIKAIKNASGTKVNDVALAIMTSVFSRHAELCGVNVKGRSIRIVVPVSTRTEAHGGDLGNHLTFAPVNMPLDIRNPKKLLAVVHERMHLTKTAGVGQWVALFGRFLGTIPSPLQAAFANFLTTLPLTVCNTICTNVPGPQTPLYLLGHEMLSAYPYVPIGGEMGINCAVLTYNGTACFGFTCDAGVAPHTESLPKFVHAAFNELRDTYLPHRTPKKKKRVRPKAPVQPLPQAKPPKPETAPEPEPVLAVASSAD